MVTIPGSAGVLAGILRTDAVETAAFPGLIWENI
jgi:hypothetical protein